MNFTIHSFITEMSKHVHAKKGDDSGDDLEKTFPLLIFAIR